MMVKVVLFDLDGTLIDSKKAIVKSFLETAKILHVTLDPKIIEENIGLNSKEILKLALKTPLNDVGIENFIKLRRKVYESLWRKEVKLYSDVLPVLKELKRRRIKVGIVSSNIKSRLKEILEYFNLEEYVDVYIGLGDYVHAKPHPEPILLALKKLNVNVKSEVYYVGDMELDCLAAKNAGIKFILIIRDRASNEQYFKKCKPDFIVYDLYELLNIICKEEK